MQQDIQAEIKKQCSRCTYFETRYLGVEVTGSDSSGANTYTSHYRSLCSSKGKNRVESVGTVYYEGGNPYDTYDPEIKHTYVNIAGSSIGQKTTFPYPCCEEILSADTNFMTTGTCGCYAKYKPRKSLTRREIVCGILDIIEEVPVFIMENFLPIAFFSALAFLGVNASSLFDETTQQANHNPILQQESLVKACLLRKGLSVSKVDLGNISNNSSNSFSYTDGNGHVFTLTDNALTETAYQTVGPHPSFRFGPGFNWSGEFKTSPGMDYSMGGETEGRTLSIVKDPELASNPRAMAMQQCLRENTL